MKFFNRIRECRFEGTGKSCAGRMYRVSPKERELYYLRMLLTYVKSATSLRSRRTIYSELHELYRYACLALGLLLSEVEW